MRKIVIIGAGVNGLSAAVKLAEYFYNNAQVILMSENVSPNTTGDISAGLWGPYLCRLDENVQKWSAESHDFFLELWQNGLADEAGVCLQPMIRVTSADNYKTPVWSKTVLGCRNLTEKQLEILSKGRKKKYVGGVHFISFTCEPTRLLPYLFKRFEQVGGRFEKRRINSFDELIKEDADLIINCTGLDSQYLAKDPKVHSIRGQVTRVRAPWIYQVFLDDDDDGNYIIPNRDNVVLGGTHQVNNYDTRISLDDDEFIMKGCQKLIPALKTAEIEKTWVGLRPARDSVRLEKELYVGKNGKTVPIIHNYGHGGSGVTLAWGCASSVLGLAKDCFRDELKSKL